MSPDHLVDMLRGGDLRSIGCANEVVDLVLRQPELFDELMDAMTHDDPVVRARAADAAEKVTAVRPELLKAHKARLLGELAAMSQPEVRWHVAAMLPRLPLSDAEVEEVVKLLRGYLDDESRIVRVMAMQALTDLALAHPQLRDTVRPLLCKCTRNGTAAMRARGRKLLRQLDRADDKR
jgi:HEAT repeat protein